ncbi:hypothetical protein [Streptomyces sp. NPDC005251]|uniref:hypothetical protein n=1 Tax=unclassified Streptomyces TaxID=2593676 RepID=UPI0033B6D38A
MSLQFRPEGSTAWSTIAKATVDSKGTARFTTTAKRNGTWRAITAEKKLTWATSTSAAVTGKVKATLTVKSPATGVHHGKSVTYHATSTPYVSGTKIYFQVRKGDGTWTTLVAAGLGSDGTAAGQVGVLPRWYLHRARLPSRRHHPDRLVLQGLDRARQLNRRPVRTSRWAAPDSAAHPARAIGASATRIEPHPSAPEAPKSVTSASPVELAVHEGSSSAATPVVRATISRKVGTSRSTDSCCREVCASSWVSFSSACVRLLCGPSLSPSQPSRSASRMRARRSSRISTSRGRSEA